MGLEHSNKLKKFEWGAIRSARPSAKAFRFESDDSVKALAKEMLRLKNLFSISDRELYQIIKQEFGEGVGRQTTEMFMDEVYGPAFRPRAKTLDKYKYFVWLMQEMEKQFANPKK